MKLTKKKFSLKHNPKGEEWSHGTCFDVRGLRKWLSHKYYKEGYFNDDGDTMAYCHN